MSTQTQTLTVNITVPVESIPALTALLKQFEPQLEQNLTRSEVCRQFDLCPTTLDRWERAKKISSSQPVKNGKKFFRRSDIVALLDAKKQPAVQPKRRKSIICPRG